MTVHNVLGGGAFERLQRRYETTDRQCPACDFVDKGGK